MVLSASEKLPLWASDFARERTSVADLSNAAELAEEFRRSADVATDCADSTGVSDNKSAAMVGNDGNFSTKGINLSLILNCAIA